jgi:hypothetical protein
MSQHSHPIAPHAETRHALARNKHANANNTASGIWRKHVMLVAIAIELRALQIEYEASQSETSPSQEEQ